MPRIFEALCLNRRKHDTYVNFGQNVGCLLVRKTSRRQTYDSFLKTTKQFLNRRKCCGNCWLSSTWSHRGSSVQWLEVLLAYRTAAPWAASKNETTWTLGPWWEVVTFLLGTDSGTVLIKYPWDLEFIISEDCGNSLVAIPKRTRAPPFEFTWELFQRRYQRLGACQG